MTTLDAALHYALFGFKVAPAHFITPDGTCSCRKAHCASPGKHPLFHGDTWLATDNEAQIRRWWGQECRYANILIATGEVSGVDVLDVDPRHGGDETLARLEKEYGALPDTVVSLTGGGGQHYFFQHTEGVRNRDFSDWPGIEVRGDGGYIIAPPSNHASGQTYQWDGLCHPDDQEIAPWPEWLDAFVVHRPNYFDGAHTPTADWLSPDVAAYAQAALRAECDKVRVAAWGHQERTLNTASYCIGTLVGAGALSSEEAHAALLDAARQMLSDPSRAPWTDELLTKKIQHGLTDGMQQPRKIPSGALFVDADQVPPFDDEGNATRFLARWGQEVRYCKDLGGVKDGGWLIWSGVHWQPDQTNTIRSLARETLRAIRHEPAVLDDKGRNATVVWHHKCQSLSRENCLLGKLVSEQSIAVKIEDLDQHPFLFNTRNGTLNLLTGERTDSQQAHLLTQQANVFFDPAARCPRWTAFLEQIMDGDRDMLAFLQRAIGYSLTGSTREQCMFILYGIGANGKSTFVETIQTLLGAYAFAADAASFTVSHQYRVRDDLAELRHTRFVPTSETGQGARLDEALIKRLTGDETVTARHLYGRHFQFRPQFKLWLATNHKPDIRGTDDGIWRRLHLLPFKVQIPDAQQDKDLPRKLQEELSGILNWALDGCRQWLERGLGRPERVLEATTEYRIEQDQLGEFLRECCDLGVDQQIAARTLYDAYARWAERGRERPLSETAFGRQLSERSYPMRRTMSGKVREGLSLKDEFAEEKNPWTN